MAFPKRLNRILHVGADVGFSTIQAAAAEAQAGDIILVAPGQHTVPANTTIQLPAEVSLLGADPHRCKISRPTSTSGGRMIATGGRNRISGLTLQELTTNSARGCPVQLSGTAASGAVTIIENCILRAWADCVYVAGSERAVIDHCALEPQYDCFAMNVTPGGGDLTVRYCSIATGADQPGQTSNGVFTFPIVSATPNVVRSLHNTVRWQNYAGSCQYMRAPCYVEGNTATFISIGNIVEMNQNSGIAVVRAFMAEGDYGGMTATSIGDVFILTGGSAQYHLDIGNLANTWNMYGGYCNVAGTIHDGGPQNSYEWGAHSGPATIGFFGKTPIGRQAAPANYDDLVSKLTAYGWF